jgi:hypothetical protein
MHTAAAKSYASFHEDKARRARHAEIALRYEREERRRRAWFAGESPKYPRGSRQLICRKRLNELQDIYRMRYGATLPYDDAGLDDLKIAAHHIAHMRGDALGHIVDWAGTWMPDLPHERAEALARDVVDEPVKFKAATLAWRLRLTEEERTALGITTIRPFGVTDADMKERQKAKARDRDARRRQRKRESQPAKPPSLAETRPWEALGMSRATWYRDGKPVPPERETKAAAQQVDVAKKMVRRDFVSPAAARHVATKKAVQAIIDRPEACSTRNTVSAERAGFRVMPWYPAHIHAQAVEGWWRRRCGHERRAFARARADE